MKSAAVGSVARGSLARGGGLIAPALTLVNLIGYLVTVSAARALSKDAYGELNAFLGVLLVASVPALALQAVVARSVARRGAAGGEGALERAVVARAAVAGLVLTLGAAALSPVVAAFLHTGLAGPLWVAAQLLPFVVLSAAMGVLQGEERFQALALGICAQAVGKALGLVPLLLSGGSASVLAALAGGTALAMLTAVALVGRRLPGGLTGSRVADTLKGLPTVRLVVAAASGLLALLVLANLDLLLARNVLSGDESGRYSAGSVLAKAAFWLPQAVAVVVFPRLSEPEAGRVLLRQAVLVVSGLGLLEVLGCLLLARPVLELTFGPTYGSLSGLASLWVVQGATLSVVQLLVYRAIAMHDRVTSRFVGAAAVVETVLVLLLHPRTPGPVIVTATAAAAALAAVLLLRSRRPIPVTPRAPAGA